MADSLQSPTQGSTGTDAATQQAQQAAASSFAALLNQITSMAKNEINS
jgi:hypothetical protein